MTTTDGQSAVTISKESDVLYTLSVYVSAMGIFAAAVGYYKYKTDYIYSMWRYAGYASVACISLGNLLIPIANELDSKTDKSGVKLSDRVATWVMIISVFVLALSCAYLINKVQQ